MDRCSFCRKGREDSKVLIKARDGHAICELCCANAALVLASFEADEKEKESNLVEVDRGAKIIDFVTARGLLLAKRGEL